MLTFLFKQQFIVQFIQLVSVSIIEILNLFSNGSYKESIYLLLWRIADTNQEKQCEWCMCVYIYNACCLVTKLLVVVVQCSTFCDPMDCSPPSSSVQGIFQARIQEWISISFSRASSQPYSRKNFLTTKFWTSFFLSSLLFYLHSFISSLFLSFFLSILLYIFSSFLLFLKELK